MAILDHVFKWGFRLLASVGALYAVSLGMMAVFQEKLVYVPRIPGMPNDYTHTPNNVQLEYEDVWLTTGDGVKIHCWLCWPQRWSREERQQRPVLLFFQENAGNLQMRLYFIRELAHYLRCSVFAVSYRGYGPSEGSPSEKGLKLDAQAALDHLRHERDDVPGGKVLLYGRSIGGAVALHVAAANPDAVRGLVIENTFTSIPELAPQLMPFLRPVIGPGRPFNFLLRQVWDNRVAAALLARKPVLWVTALRDEMVPASMMRTLYETAQDAQGWVWDEYPEGHHMDISDVYPRQYWGSLQNFVSKLVDGPGDAAVEAR